MDSDADFSDFLSLSTADSVETESKMGKTPTARVTCAHTRPARDGEAQFHRDRPIQYLSYY